MTRLLVTGGAGFIGRHLCAAAALRGDRVTVLDDLSSGDATQLPANVALIQGDVCDPEIVARAMVRADVVVHLAAISSVEACAQDRARTGRINRGGTEVVVAAANDRPVVFTSSAAVYGDQPVLPVTEGLAPRPISPYAEDKVAAEACLAAASTPSVVLRPFNVYGPGQVASSPYSGVISRFIARAEAGAALQINGDGAQTRDFIHVSDVAQALLRAVDHAQVERPAMAVANVCSGAAMTILDLARLVNQLAGSPAPIGFGAARAGDIRHSLGDPTQAKARLGFTARTPMVQGLGALIRPQTAAFTDSSK